MIIFGVTNRGLCTDFYTQIKKIAKSKLDYLIIREKDLDYKSLLNLALTIKEELKNSNIKIIVNSNIDVAEKIEADGLQLSFNDFIDFNNKLCTQRQKNNMGNVNKLKNMDIKIGVSIHSYEEGIQAFKLGANYVIYGHVFETECKKGLKPRGIEEIIKLSKKINIPIIGLGGINEKNYEEVIEAGASGIAIMSSLMKCDSAENLIYKFITKE